MAAGRRSAPPPLPLELRSMLSFQLYTDTDTLGALNIYAPQVAAFTEDSEHTGTLLAAHAAVAATANTRHAHLRVALGTRDVIGQAKGILMERYKITAEQAFDLLISASSCTNLKLREVAEQLSTTPERDHHLVTPPPQQHPRSSPSPPPTGRPSTGRPSTVRT